MERNKKDRHSRQIKNRTRVRAKIQTPKILDRITFDPAKHKQKKTRELRQQLQQQKIPGPDPSPTTTCLFGSFNLNGLDLETSWAVEQLVKKHEFDVRFPHVIKSFMCYFLRCQPLVRPMGDPTNQR